MIYFIWLFLVYIVDYLAVVMDYRRLVGRILISCIMICYAIRPLFGQDGPLLTQCESFRKQADADLNQVDSILHYLYLTKNCYESIYNWERIVRTHRDIALQYYNRLNKISIGDSLVEHAWKLSQEKLDLSDSVDLREYAITQYFMGDIYYYTYQNYPKAINDYYKPALDVLQDLDNVDTRDLIDFLLHVGRAYRRMGDLGESERYYAQALARCNDQKCADDYAPSVYQMTGQIFAWKEQWDSAMVYLNLAESIINKEPGSVKPELILNTFLTKADVLIKTGKVGMATKYIQSAKKVRSKIPPAIQANLFRFEGDIKSQLGDQIKAIQLYTAGIELAADNTLPIHDLSIGLSEAFSSLQKPILVLEALQAGLESVSDNWKTKSYLELPHEDSIINPLAAIKILRYKSKALRKLAQEKDSSLYLNHAIQHCRLGHELILKIRKNLVSEDSKIQLGQVASKLYEEALDVIYILDHRHATGKLMEEAFKYIEANKSMALYTAMLDQKAKMGLSDSLRHQEKRLKEQLIYLNTQLRKTEQKAGEKDSTLLISLQRDHFAAQDAYNSFLEELEENNPRYFREKYQLDFASIKSIQRKLNKNDCFINYFWGKESLYQLFVFNDKVLFKRLNALTSLGREITEFYQLISQPPNHTTDVKWQKLGHSLFQRLFPVETSIGDVNNLYICPDGLLNYLPFESLLTEETAGANIRYNELPYLMQDMPIAYELTGTYWLRRGKRPKRFSQISWLGVAPIYKDSLTVNDFAQLVLGTRSNIGALPFAEKEVKQISTLWQQNALIGENATEANFRQEALGKDYIHLALHGILSDRKDEFNSLLFSSEGDISHDGRLHAYEIYDLQFPTELMVLSACNTGVGNFQKGEGIMSLSRAFTYAGAKSLLMSLWQVSDASTSQLMLNFNRNLLEKEEKHKALRLARIQYLDQQEVPSKCHPYYWAGFILQGDTQALVRSRSIWVFILFILTVSTLYVLLQRTYSRPE